MCVAGRGRRAASGVVTGPGCAGSSRSLVYLGTLVYGSALYEYEFHHRQFLVSARVSEHEAGSVGALV